MASRTAELAVLLPLGKAVHGGGCAVTSGAQNCTSPPRPALCCAAQATVPMIELSSYRRQWFLASMACSPLFICAYLGQLHWLGLLVAMAVGGGLAAAAAAGTRALGNKPPLWSCGTHFPVGEPRCATLCIGGWRQRVLLLG